MSELKHSGRERAPTVEPMKETSMRTIFVLVCLSLAAGCLAESRTVAEEELEISGEGLDVLLLDVGAGELDVVGDPTLETIHVSVRLRTNQILDRDDDARSGLVLSGEREGTEASVLVNLDDVPTGYSADVIIALPERLRLVAVDGSGDTRVSRVASVRVRDGSGELVIEEIAGDVAVDDDSGTIEVRRVGGDVDIRDGSGDIDVREVRGVVRIDDGSGDIDVENVSELEILEDGSGEVSRH